MMPENEGGIVLEKPRFPAAVFALIPLIALSFFSVVTNGEGASAGQDLHAEANPPDAPRSSVEGRAERSSPAPPAPAASQRPHKETGAANETSAAHDTPEPGSSTRGSLLRGVYKGAVAPDIRIEMTLRCEAGRLRGTYEYVSQGNPVDVRGECFGDRVRIVGYYRGELIDVFEGAFTSPSYMMGTWRPVDGREERAFWLERSAERDSGHAAAHAPSAEQGADASRGGDGTPARRDSARGRSERQHPVVADSPHRTGVVMEAVIGTWSARPPTQRDRGSAGITFYQDGTCRWDQTSANRSECAWEAEDLEGVVMHVASLTVEVHRDGSALTVEGDITYVDKLSADLKLELSGSGRTWHYRK